VKFERIHYIPFDHLNRDYGVLKSANQETDLIAIIESQRMITGRNWHPERIYFMISAARHFAKELSDGGFNVVYRKAATTIDGLKEIKSENNLDKIVCAEPSSFRQFAQLKEFGVDYVENDFFLTSRPLFKLWADSQKSYLMENFYRKQRVRLNILMDGDKPVGDKWNYDSENRLPPPKNYEWQPYLAHELDEIDLEVASELGHTPTRTWGTTRKQAIAQLNFFLDKNFENFGPYEDAIPKDNWAVHHSLLSPYMNIGLLPAKDVVTAVLQRYAKGGIPIESCEAFIRQVIGWREYINGMYWYLGEDYKNQNGLNANRKLLPLFIDPTKTKMNCVGSIVKDVDERGWVHHIPRLMILSNLALITGTNPQEYLDWMRERFIDASDWVMVPNVIGMAVHADNGKLMTKPYAAGGAYINRMTEFCKGCKYDPKKRIGEDACPYATLYWDFLDRHKDEFIKNHRMSQMVNGLKRLSDLPETRQRAQEVLRGLDSGKI
jgi:deoxyribodipyrimidine photolyase-related protein